MTTDRELCLLETYAREGFRGRGRIIDLGCWYGATTLSLARGLEANRRARAHRIIEAFDTFEWQLWMDPMVELLSLPRRYAAGESFYPEVRELLQPYAHLVRLEAQDLTTYTPRQEPIEFLFVDAMKSWELAHAIVSGFFPLLVPRAYVVQQDFAYYFPQIATNHLTMWLLRKHFRWVHHVPESCSVVFECLTPPRASELPLLTPNLFTPDMIEAAYDYSRQCVSPDARIMLEVAKLNFHIEQGQVAAAEQQMATVAHESSQLTVPMLNEIDAVAGRALAQGSIGEAAFAAIRRWTDDRRAAVQRPK